MGNYSGLRPFVYADMTFQRIRMLDEGKSGAVWRVYVQNPEDPLNKKRVFIPDMIGDKRSTR